MPSNDANTNSTWNHSNAYTTNKLSNAINNRGNTSTVHRGYYHYNHQHHSNNQSATYRNDNNNLKYRSYYKNNDNKYSNGNRKDQSQYGLSDVSATGSTSAATTQTTSTSSPSTCYKRRPFSQQQNHVARYNGYNNTNGYNNNNRTNGSSWNYHNHRNDIKTTFDPSYNSSSETKTECHDKDINADKRLFNEGNFFFFLLLLIELSCKLDTDISVLI